MLSFIKDSMIYTHEIAFPSEVKKAVLKVSFFSFILLTQPDCEEKSSSPMFAVGSLTIHSIIKYASHNCVPSLGPEQ